MRGGRDELIDDVLAFIVGCEKARVEPHLIVATLQPRMPTCHAVSADPWLPPLAVQEAHFPPQWSDLYESMPMCPRFLINAASAVCPF